MSRSQARALLKSSLLHFAHVRCLQVRELKHRRIFDRSRYDGTADADLDVRVPNHIESLDCVLARRRGYIARL